MWFFPSCENKIFSESWFSSLFHELLLVLSPSLATGPLSPAPGWSDHGWSQRRLYLLLWTHWAPADGPPHPISERSSGGLSLTSLCYNPSGRTSSSLAYFLQGCSIRSRGLVFTGLLPTILRGLRCQLLSWRKHYCLRINFYGQLQ